MPLEICRPPKSILQQQSMQNFGAHRVNYVELKKKKRIEQAGYFLSQFNDTHSDFWLVEGVLEIWLD